MTELTEEEVLQILNLIEKSSFDFLQLEYGDLKLTVSKTGYVGNAVDPHTGAAEAATPAAPKIEKKKKEREPKVDRPKGKPAEVAVKPGTVAVKAPMVGTFYTTPEPGAPPYVEVDKKVDEDTTVGLIEVMKVFTAVKAGVRGTIAEVGVQNGQFVEYGQALFLVKPE